MKKLVLFGDSLLGRVGIDLTNKIKEAIPGVEVYNCSAGGFNSRDSRERVAYIAKLRPDYVVISFGGNDRGHPKYDPVVPLKEYEDNMEAIIGAFSESKVAVWLMPPANDPSDKKLTEVFNKELVKYHEIAKRVCEKTGASCIDSFEIYKPLVESDTNYHVEDGIHSSDEGYEPFIKSLAEIISPTA